MLRSTARSTASAVTRSRWYRDRQICLDRSCSQGPHSTHHHRLLLHMRQVNMLLSTSCRIPGGMQGIKACVTLCILSTDGEVQRSLITDDVMRLRSTPMCSWV